MGRASGALPLRAHTAPVSAETFLGQVQNFEVFQTTQVEVLKHLLQCSTVRRAQVGQCLIQAGGRPDGMFVVIDGSLAVYLPGSKPGEPVARLRAGDVAGELSLIDQSPASADVLAETECLALLVNEGMFWWLVSVSHGFATALLIKLAERLRSSNSTVRMNVELRHHFERAALYDVLTGVHSRRWLHDTWPRLVQRHKRSGQALSVAVVDIDHFKRINDQHGHATGDEVLRALGGILQHHLRPTDLVARYGGEEFVVVFPGTPLQGAVCAAERLHAAVHDLHTRDPSLPPTTVSIGIATLELDADPQALLDRADQALYAAKRGGRDRTCTSVSSEG